MYRTGIRGTILLPMIAYFLRQYVGLWFGRSYKPISCSQTKRAILHLAGDFMHCLAGMHLFKLSSAWHTRRERQRGLVSLSLLYTKVFLLSVRVTWFQQQLKTRWLHNDLMLMFNKAWQLNVFPRGQSPVEWIYRHCCEIFQTLQTLLRSHLNLIHLLTAADVWTNMGVKERSFQQIITWLKETTNIVGWICSLGEIYQLG